MKTTHDLSSLDWYLAGFAPYHWNFPGLVDIRHMASAEIPALRAKAPGSVQETLRQAGLLPDWNVGLNYRLCEWVENRHWVYQAILPDDWFSQGEIFRLCCEGLDANGLVLLNGREVGRFDNAFIPYLIDLTPHLKEHENRLQIVFECPHRWLGQLGYTSKMTTWKPRFYYTWDWVARLVQVGIWDAITLEVINGSEITRLSCVTDVDLSDNLGILHLHGEAVGRETDAVALILAGPQGSILEDRMSLPEFNTSGLDYFGLPVLKWWPNGMGEQPLYTLTCRLLDEAGQVLDQQQRTVGFKHIEWLPCEGAPAEADPWICSVNGEPVFLQGINWVPIRPNFADLTGEDYRQRLALYQELGINLLRVWGGAVLEKACFYDLCDRLGLLVWQEFPLSSSGLDNWPPEDEASIAALAATAESYIVRRQHHVSLLVWCGGNELMGAWDDQEPGVVKPAGLGHPLLRRLGELAEALDPQRRFLATSASGPRESATPEDFGKGLHWDVHGPWKMEKGLAEWENYWNQMDSLFNSELGAPGASPAEIIRRSAGDCPVMPGSADNPLWQRTSWWIEWPEFIKEVGREPATLEEYVDWSQARQARALTIVAQALKGRFPRCGGMILWMGHDCFPCTANTSIVDFDGRPKPAALALKEIFRAAVK